MDNFYNKELKQRQTALKRIQKTVGHMMLADKRSIGSQTDESLLEEWFKVREDEKPQSDDMSNFGRANSKINKKSTPGLLKYQ